MLVEAFKTSIFPYLCQIAVVMFVYSLCGLGYTMFRKPDFQMLIDKLKGYIFAYIIVKGAFVIVNFIDQVVGKLQ
ncbi:MAG: hypothetical protein PHY08_13345 [Candidatus Cloacimonetes bacterium]|jgi:hypothetical protein|nr:hypothetical protein [Candidatus Cloacimonadota bacterium]